MAAGVEEGGVRQAGKQEEKKDLTKRSCTASSQLGNMSSVSSKSLAIEKVQYNLALNIYAQQ